MENGNHNTGICMLIIIPNILLSYGSLEWPTSFLSQETKFTRATLSQPHYLSWPMKGLFLAIFDSIKVSENPLGNTMPLVRPKGYVENDKNTLA